MTKLMRYLDGVKSLLATQCLTDIHIVLGNEACDLDSAVSAIVYAFLLHSLQKNETRTTVPLLNICRDDFPLKTEVAYWLKKHNISEDHLIFRDDLDFPKQEIADMEMTLVDHNVLAIKDKHLEPNVVQILDHHKLERQNPEKVRNGVTIEMVGSCSTLVAEEALEKLPEIMDDTIASLLYGTIILDTVNLSQAAKRVTEKDIKICGKLCKFFNAAPDNAEIFGELTAAKSDISSLSNEQLLRKDLKIAEDHGLRVAVASVPLAVEEFLRRRRVSEDLSTHSENHNYDVIVMMGITITEDSVKRDIAIFSRVEDLKTKIANHLTTVQEGILQLQPFDTVVRNCSAYRQGNHAASRKVILPLIKDWLGANIVFIVPMDCHSLIP